MNMPQIDNYYSPSKDNAMFVAAGPVEVYFSYRTPIAFAINNGKRVVRQNEWGSTTGKHLNQIDGGSKAARKARVSGDEFKRLFQELTTIDNALTAQQAPPLQQ